MTASVFELLLYFRAVFNADLGLACPPVPIHFSGNRGPDCGNDAAERYSTWIPDNLSCHETHIYPAREQLGGICGSVGPSYQCVLTLRWVFVKQQ